MNHQKLLSKSMKKNRKKPVSLAEAQARKARQGVKVHAKQLEFVRPLKRDSEDYMKLSKNKKKVEEKKVEEKKEGEKTAEVKPEEKKEEKKDGEKKTDPKSKSKKKKAKAISTAEFFKGTQVPKKTFNNRRGPKNPKQGKKGPNLNINDTQNFPKLQ